MDGGTSTPPGGVAVRVVEVLSKVEEVWRPDLWDEEVLRAVESCSFLPRVCPPPLRLTREREDSLSRPRRNGGGARDCSLLVGSLLQEEDSGTSPPSGGGTPPAGNAGGGLVPAGSGAPTNKVGGGSAPSPAGAPPSRTFAPPSAIGDCASRRTTPRAGMNTRLQRWTEKEDMFIRDINRYYDSRDRNCSKDTPRKEKYNFRKFSRSAIADPRSCGQDHSSQSTNRSPPPYVASSYVRMFSYPRSSCECR